MEKIIEFTPGYDKRNSDPNKNYGIHGMNLRFVLKGERGATQFLIYTNWMLPHVAQEELTKATFIKSLYLPMGADVGYHSLEPMYPDQLRMSDSCEYLDGQPCYYDGSGLAADDLMDVFLKEGDAAVWKHLLEYYNRQFDTTEKLEELTK